MKRIPTSERHHDDCVRIKWILCLHGWDATIEECCALWERYSEDRAAGWIFLPREDLEVYACISAYLPGTDADGRDV